MLFRTAQTERSEVCLYNKCYNAHVSFPRVFLKAEKEKGILKKHHPWLFSEALHEANKPENGGLCDVFLSDEKTFFARGYYNQFSNISIRILTRNPEEKIDQSFFEKKFRELAQFRERFIDKRETNAYRVVFGESDGLPGLIVDSYNQTYVIQIHTAGMEQLKPLVIDGLKKVFSPKTIYERSDVNVRLKEGLKECPRQHIFGGKIDGEIKILEHGIPFFVNVTHGQKTGFFLDQRENRKALQKYSAGKRILNCFCYTAGFSAYAALGGAKQTVNVDIAPEALETAKRNFQLNKLPVENHQFIKADVFDYLETAIKEKQNFDMVILDPPAFVKNKKTLKSGLSGYLRINERALTLLPKGGILVSSSCSAHVSDEMFKDMLALASHRARCILKILEIRHQPPDHPYNLDFPEGKYLKFWVCVKI